MGFLKNLGLSGVLGANTEILFFIILFLLLFWDTGADGKCCDKGGASDNDATILFFILIFLLLFFDNGCEREVREV